MNESEAQLSEDQLSVPETPEDVAILYSWANMPGAKYRDFSASRRQYRAQQRVRIAEQQRQAELQAAKELEAAAQREFEEAQRIREQSRQSDLAQPSGWDDQFRSRELVRRAEEHALRERQEAQRRQQSAETLEVQAQRARSEMLDARKRAEEQAARYAEAAAQFHEEVRAEAGLALPGEISDPYYYTGQVDPAYFASTPGVRTAQAGRISTERRAYTYPVHPGSDEHDTGSLQAYRGNTTFAPSPSQTFRPVRSAAGVQPGNQVRNRSFPNNGAGEEPTYPADDDYYDGKPPAVTILPQVESRTPEGAQAVERDVLIRPIARTPDPLAFDFHEPEAHLQQDEMPEREPLSVASLPQDAPPSPTTPRVEDAPVRMAALEAFAQGSQLFVDRPGPDQNFLPAEEQTKSSPETQVIADERPRETDRERQERAGGFAPSTTEEPLQDRPRRESPQDLRVRLARHASQLSVNSTPQTRRPASRPPSWLEPMSEQAQRFLPPRLRPGADRVSPSASVPTYKSSSAGLSSGATAGPEIRRSERTLRYNRNLDRGKNYSAIANAFDRRRASSQNMVERTRTSDSQTASGTHAPDTLQQSRERVASQWYALKGLLEHAPETVEPGLHASELRIPSLCVMSLSGGVGKTSIAATLGRALSSLGEKVLLADTNPHGLLPYYFGAKDLRPGTVRTFTPAGGVEAPVLLVNCDIEGVSGNEAAQRRIIEEIGRRARGSQWIVVDLSAPGAWLAKRLASVHPCVLIPVAPDTNSVVTTQAVERLFAGMVDAEGHTVMPYYVLNQYDPSLPLHLDVREVLRRSLGERLLRVTLRRSASVAEALAQGMTVVDYAPSAAITEDYMHLADWLRNLSAPGAGATQDSRWSER